MSPRTRIALFLLLAVLVAIALSFRWYKTSQKKNIIVLMVDTLRADHLSSYGYQRSTSPAIDRLGADGLRCTRAYAAAPWTAPGVASILSGLYPSVHTVQPPKRLSEAKRIGHRVPDEVKLIGEYLSSEGFQTAGVSSNPWISKEFNFSKGFDRFVYEKHVNAQRVVTLAKEEIENFGQKPSVPFLLYVHFFDPHAPYKPPADFQNPFTDFIQGDLYSEKMQQQINNYDAEIAYTDLQIADFVSFLKGRGLYDDSIIVFVADHGEAFNEHGEVEHGFHVHVEEVAIPLIVKAPGLTGTIEAAVSQIDIVPTLLEAVGIARPDNLQGISLYDQKAINQRSGVFSETYRVYRERALSTGEGTRLLTSVDSDSDTTMKPSGLFDTREDPHELRPMQNSELQNELMGYLKSIVKKNAPRVKAQEQEISDDTMKQLETLGYINN